MHAGWIQRGSRVVAGVMLVAALPACYSYHVVPTEQLSVGKSVRARLSADEATRLQGVLGRTDRTLDGRLMASSDSGLLMAVPTSRIGPEGITHQRILVPRSSLLEVEERRLDRFRTGIVVAAITAVAAAVVVTQFDVGSPNDGEPKGGTDHNILGVRIPLLALFGR
ncbi:MAG TPA: hypothetical protein VFG84_06575 [Gemmatimonadaceae bacterium]|nr:hypothetical protein [Gemmatimonadaceae bacterium]